MSKKDGKTILLKALDKKGFHTLKEPNNAGVTVCENAAEACPVNIIKVKLI
jgi:ferredoxin